jgi:hypothetical protein
VERAWLLYSYVKGKEKWGDPTNFFGWVPKAQEGLPSSFNDNHWSAQETLLL